MFQKELKTHLLLEIITSGDGPFRGLHKRIPNWGFWKPNHYTTDIKSSWHVICKKKSAIGFELSLHIFKSYVLDGWYMTRVHNSKLGHGIVYWHHCLEQCLLVWWNFRPAKDKNPCFVMGKAIKKAMRRWVCPKLAKDILRNVTAVNLMSSFLALPLFRHFMFWLITMNLQFSAQ